MNIVLLRFTGIIAGLIALVFLFAKFAPSQLVARVYESVNWTIDKAFLFFVDLAIFLKPLKKHREKVGIMIWLFFAFLVGNYLITEQPLITEIDSPYLPFIGYIYLLSVLYIMKFVIKGSGKLIADHK